MPESPIRKLAPLAAAAKKRGTKVYHLNIGQPDLPTPQCGLDALKHIDRKVLEYSPSQGYLSYREKLVSYYAKYNISVTADDIIITSGGSEAVLFAFMSCLNPGDEIIVPEPAYANYMAFAISAGARGKDTHHCHHDRRRFLASEGRKVRGTDQRAHPRDNDLQPQQPHGLSLHTPRDEPDTRPGKEIRPLSLLRRGVPGVYLHRFAIHFGLPPGRYRRERGAYRLCVECRSATASAAYAWAH